MTRPHVALIGTGGTISSLGRDSLDILDYGANNRRLEASQIAVRVPELAQVAEVTVVDYRAIVSPDIDETDWRALVAECLRLQQTHDDLAGIVITHGTATLEETAWCLSLTLPLDIPVIVTGAQRPLSALSSDAGMNLVNAVRAAGSPATRNGGVMVLLNDELHAAREVTKTNTTRLQTFQSPISGPLGHVDGEHVQLYRQGLRRTAPNTEFSLDTIDPLPRVDIAYSYAGSDGAAIRAFVAAGARGIVAAGFAPGFVTGGERAALIEAVDKGVVVVQSTRAGSGNVYRGHRLREAGFLVADNLNPQKARLLLALALGVTHDPAEITRIFAEY
ncbi:asparaginase [Salinicola salarius]|uniref:asparaginase n=1 Tax=Salinicola salarius TaxID=430457 RepID=UPI000B4005C4|nr:asparaginase [Salinicola salarius]